MFSLGDYSMGRALKPCYVATFTARILSVAAALLFEHIPFTHVVVPNNVMKKYTSHTLKGPAEPTLAMR